MQNRILLGIGILLIGLGIFKPNFIINNSIVKPECSAVETYVIDAPADTTLIEKANNIIDILKKSEDSTRKNDCLKLSSLYSDMATLIELDNEDTVIKDTAAIKQANSLSGKMLRLNIKDKYPNLAESSRELVVSAIGDDDVVLDNELRIKAVNAFRALSWAFYEGSK